MTHQKLMRINKHTMTNTIKTKTVGLCAICVRDIAVRKGILVHHGYQRPGHGFIVGDCRCVGQAPYELSCEPLRPYLVSLQARLTTAEERLARMKAGEVTELHVLDVYGRNMTAIRADDPNTSYAFERELKSRIWRDERHIKDLTAEIARIEQLIASWKLMPLRTVTKDTTPKVHKYVGLFIRRDGVSGSPYTVFEDEACTKPAVFTSGKKAFGYDLRTAKRDALNLVRARQKAQGA